MNIYLLSWPEINLELPCQEFRPFFVLNAANVSEENEKLVRTTCITLTYTPMNDRLKKLFFDISSMEYKSAPAIEVKVETVNFNLYWSSRKQKSYQGNKTNLIDRPGKIMHRFKCNLAKHFTWDCISFSSRNYINTVKTKYTFLYLMLTHIIKHW